LEPAKRIDTLEIRIGCVIKREMLMFIHSGK